MQVGAKQLSSVVWSAEEHFGAVELCAVRVLRLPHAHLEEVPGMLGGLLEAVVLFV